MVQDAGLLGAQPVVGVGTQDAVLAMGVRRAGRGGRGRHGGHRTAGALLAVLGLLVASLLSGLAASSPAAAKDKVVFHVGMLGEGVDSLNPFLGFQAPSYEMWGLTYDYLTGYTMKDMSPAPGLATKWTTSSDGKTWTFTVRSGVKFSDGVPLTAADVAYTYNRILHGTVEQSNWLSYLNGVTKVTAPNATTVVLKLKQPSRDPAAAADPDRARAHLEERQREGDQELPGRADRRQAGRRLRAVPAGPGHRGRLDVQVRGQPRLLGRHAPHRRGRLPVLQERRLRRAGPDQGRDRLRREHHRARGEEPAEPRRRSPPTTATPRASTRSPSTPARCRPRRAGTRSATRTRPCSTRSSGTRSATRSTCRS